MKHIVCSIEDMETAYTLRKVIILTTSTEKNRLSEYTHTINGKGETSVKCFEVINPAIGAVLTLAPNASPEQLDNAVTAAQRAYSVVAPVILCRAARIA